MDPEHYFQCMSCRVEFDRVSLYERLGSNFMKTEFRNIRKEILYEREKTFFPATQAIVEKEIEVEKMIEQTKNLDKKYDQIKKDRLIPLKEFRTSTEVMKVSDALDKYLSIQANIEIVDEQLQEEREGLISKIESMRNNNTTASKKTYVLACTNSTCKGMLATENKNKEGHYVCAMCESITCCECKMGIEKGSDHTCDPDILKTLQYMDSSSKPCPGCQIRIHKISGCDAMFCTSCHVSFSWKTLRITNGNVHNPHQAEWLRLNRNRAREIGDIQCGRELTIEIALILDTNIRKAGAKDSLSATQQKECKSNAEYLFESIRVGVHHTMITLPNLSRNRYGHRTNETLRIRLLKSEIEEDYFKQEIQRIDKATSRRQELLQVVMTYRDALTDIIWKFVDTRQEYQYCEWKGMVAEIRALEEYVDGCFKKISDVFGSSICYTIMSNASIH